MITCCKSNLTDDVLSVVTFYVTAKPRIANGDRVMVSWCTMNSMIRDNLTNFGIYSPIAGMRLIGAADK